MKYTTLFILLFIIFVYPDDMLAQLSKNARVRNVEIKYYDDKVFVPYSIVHGKESDSYVVWVEFFNENNQPFKAHALSGDIGTVYGNGSKLASWDAKADGVVLNEKIYAKVNAKLLPEASLSKAFAFSTILPGAGQYQFKQGAHWLKGILAYGLIGGATGTYIMSNNAHNKYASSDIPASQDPNFQKASDYKKASLIMAGSGLAIWLLDYAGLLSKSKKQKQITPQMVVQQSGYKHFAAQTPTKHINNRGLPPNLFAELFFQDDNGNGILEAEENAKIRIVVSNRGAGDALNLDVNISSDINDRSLKITKNNHRINRLKSNESKEIVIPITTDIDLKTSSHTFEINVREQFGYDMDPAYLILNTYAYQPPKFTVSGHEIIDFGAGTYAMLADGKLQAGEQVMVKLILQNTGQGEAKDVDYEIFTTDEENIFIDETKGELSLFEPGEVKEIFFTLSPNRRVETKDNLPIFIRITEEIGRGSIQKKQLPIALDQSPPEPNIVEIQSNVESLKTEIARFESTSKKFITSPTNIVNISAVAPSQTKREKSVGVVIGVSQYKELPTAPYADNDARIMKEYFEKVLGVEQVILFTNDQVSGFFFDDIFNPELGELQKAVVDGETEVFIYYSGHGIPDHTGRNVFLFPHDGRVARLETQGYNLEKLYDNLRKLGAKHITIILDACFSGASRSTAKIETENLVGQKGVRVRPRYSWVDDPNFTVISSSTGEETSMGYDEAETGLFTYYLALGLMGAADSNNDGNITLGELRKFVTKNVKDTSTKIRGLQTPIFHGDDSRVLVRY